MTKKKTGKKGIIIMLVISLIIQHISAVADTKSIYDNDDIRETIIQEVMEGYFKFRNEQIRNHKYVSDNSFLDDTVITESNERANSVKRFLQKVNITFDSVSTEYRNNKTIFVKDFVVKQVYE